MFLEFWKGDGEFFWGSRRKISVGWNGRKGGRIKEKISIREKMEL